MSDLDGDLQKLASLPPAALQRELMRMRERPPSPRRDALMAMALLRLAAQLPHKEAQGYFLSGYSYSRTSRHPEVRRLAEELRPRFEEG